MNNGKIKLMEVCGTHTMAIARSGIKKLLPSHVELVSGPGCPVCVTSPHGIDKAIAIAGLPDVIMTTFGDMMRVPGTKASLSDMKTKGADVRVVYSSLDALPIALENPQKKIVFMGVGFETTSPTIAATVIEAKRKKIKNFFLLSNFKLIFPAMYALSRSKDIQIDGYICPGHISVVTGSTPYKDIAQRYRKPCVITGFEDIEIIKGIKKLIEMIKNHHYTVEIAYTSVVNKEGNKKARRVLSEVFNVCDSEWRGFGIIKKSGLKIKRSFSRFDAEKEFEITVPRRPGPKGCLCGDVLRAIKRPTDCKLFKKACTPEKPVGPCMVSSEGTCAAYYKYE